MFRTLRYQLRGMVYGFLLATIVWGFVLAPHTKFEISATNRPAEIIKAENDADKLKGLFKEAAKTEDKHEKR